MRRILGLDAAYQAVIHRQERPSAFAFLLANQWLTKLSSTTSEGHFHGFCCMCG